MSPPATTSVARPSDAPQRLFEAVNFPVQRVDYGFDPTPAANVFSEVALFPVLSILYLDCLFSSTWNAW